MIFQDSTGCALLPAKMMTRFIRHFSVIALCAIVLTGCTKPAVPAKKAAPAASRPARAYLNPVYAGSMPDPSVIRSKGVYYAFGTTGTERTRDGRVFSVLRSRDLVSWERLGGAVMPPS